MVVCRNVSLDAVDSGYVHTTRGNSLVCGHRYALGAVVGQEAAHDDLRGRKKKT